MKKLITVKMVTDALGILSTGSLKDNLYMFDDNRRGGSQGEGTSALVTVLDFKEKQPKEYEIIWFVMNMRPDVAVRIEDMQVDSDAVCITRNWYEDTDISYWTACIEKEFDTIEGTMRLHIAGCNTLFTHKFTIKGKELKNE